MVKEETIGTAMRFLVGAGVFAISLATALPDTAPASPRAIVQAIGMGLIGAGVYLGAPRPLEEPT